jgi:hypothetical protein
LGGKRKMALNGAIAALKKRKKRKRAEEKKAQLEK